MVAGKSAAGSKKSDDVVVARNYPPQKGPRVSQQNSASFFPLSHFLGFRYLLRHESRQQRLIVPFISFSFFSLLLLGIYSKRKAGALHYHMH
jgi:ABC-type multidrug transport system permease subunit